MACDTRIPAWMTAAERYAEIRNSIANLEKLLASGAVTLTVGKNGAVAFAGWNDRRDVTDLCAFRRLQVQGSPALRRALELAERRAGRRLDARQVAAGVHSHDGGTTWHPGH